MDIKYNKRKRFDIKGWLLGGNSKLYMIIIAVFAVLSILVFRSLKNIDYADINAGEEETETDAIAEKETTAEEDDDVYIEDSLSYKIRINISTHVLTVYKMLHDESYTAVYTFHCAVNSNVTTGETTISAKQPWIRNNDYSYGHYACLLGNGAYIHSAPYWNQDKTSLSVTSYNNIGKTVTVGSIYLKAADAKWIYENCGISIPVEIYELADEAPAIAMEEFTPLSGSAYYDPSDK